MTIAIHYDRDQTLEVPQGSSLEEVLKLLPQRDPAPVAAIVNGGLQELGYRLYAPSEIQWLDYYSPNGHRIYKRSLIFVLLVAAKRLFPERRLHISHSLENGSYCRLEGAQPLQAAEVERLQTMMWEIVAADLPIHCNSVSREDAVAFFANEGKADKAALIALRQNNRINLYTLDTETEYFFGRMANRTGLLNQFQLLYFDEGILLRLPPQRHIGFDNADFLYHRRLQATLQEYHQHSDRLGVRTVSDLNRVIEQGDSAQLSMVEETIQDRSLHKIADNIAADFPQVRLVLIAGPSCSGKTTFTQRLSTQFRALGIHPIPISMDDYFIDREDTPLDDEGKYDFESIRALDLPLFNQHLADLIAGKEVQIPRYNFVTGRRAEESYPCRLEEDKIILIEGIHGLNDMLTEAIPAKQKRKIYISALTQLNMDDYTPIPSSDNRLYRRIVRDMQFRGKSAEESLLLWPSVRKGEAKNIFAFQENADYYFNSAMLYELAALRKLVEPALAAIESDSPVYLEAKRLLRFIQYFLPMDDRYIPNDSILQEFLGGSIFNI